MLDEIVLKNTAALGPTDQLIWKYIYNHKKQCAKMSIYELAAACNVSRTTVLRFTQKISLDGFSELKALLKLEDKQRPAFSGSDVIDEISTQYRHVMEDIRKKDFSEINRLIYEANRIIGYGTGAIQKNVLGEMKRLFAGSGEFIAEYEGGDEFAFIIQNLRKGDLLIIVSLSGETPAVLKHLHRLQAMEIPVISITQFGENTLARESAENIYVATQLFHIYAGDKPYPYTSMTVYYAVVEIIFLQYQLYKRQRELEDGSFEA